MMNWSEHGNAAGDDAPGGAREENALANAGIVYHNAPENASVIWDDPDLAEICGSAALATRIRFTRFPDKTGRDQQSLVRSLLGIARLVLETKAPEKDKLPLLKLAGFGLKRTAKGSLRTNANMLGVSGVEADYDAGEMTPEEAADRLAAAGVLALVYTSPSHMQPGKGPRWRVFAPLSKKFKTEYRATYVEWLNGVLGGVIAPESFVASQSYFIGGIEGQPDPLTFLVDGRPINLCDHLEAGAIGKKKGALETATGGVVVPFEYDGEAEGGRWPMIVAALGYLSPDAPRDKWLAYGMGLHHEAQGGPQGLALWDAWSSGGTRLAGDGSPVYPGPEAIARDYDGFRLIEGGVTADTLLADAREAASERLLLADNDAPDEGAPAVSPKPAKLLVTKTGEARGGLHNAIVFLRRVLEARRLRWNLLAKAVEIEGVRVDDHALALFRIEIECAGMPTVTKELVTEAVRVVAHWNEYHPVQEHLEGLPAWDGVPRLDTWLTHYLGVDDTPYTRAVGRAFPISMVARAKLPGCKADHMLVLGGDQGLKKSMVCKILAERPEWFTDALPDIAKDSGDPAMKALRGKWLVEVGELVAARKSEQAELKAFIVREIDEYRVAYDREQTSAPRQAVLIGTTNDDEFLRDATGDRRYWPVWCKGPVKIEDLQRDRAQLFAEALAAFKAGEQWHLTDEVEGLAREVQASYAETDTWDDALRKAASGTLPTDRDLTMNEVLAEGLGIPTDRQTPVTVKRAAAALRRLGWERVHTMVGKRWRPSDAFKAILSPESSSDDPFAGEGSS